MTNFPKQTDLTKADIETIRQKVQKLLDDREISQNKLARQLKDVSAATLSQFVAGKYEGNIRRVAQELQNWLTASQITREIQEQVGGEIPFVETSASKSIKMVMQMSMACSDIGTVTAKPGLGKTRTGTEMCISTPRCYMVTASPKRSGASVIMRMFIRKIGLGESASNDRNRVALEEHLRDNIALLIVDEAQHLSVDALEELRAIHDETGCGLVFMGNNHVVSRLKGGVRAAEFAQFTSRIGTNVNLSSQPAKADIDLILDAMGIEGSKEREVLHKVGKTHGALRKIDKVVKFARMSVANDAGPDAFLPALQHAAERLSAKGVA